jgi:hypothetical protein
MSRIIAVLISVILLVPTMTVVAKAQAGPPTPPELTLAMQRGKSSMYRSCQKVDYVININGLSVGENGKCRAFGVVRSVYTIKFPDGYDKSGAPRASVIGRLAWQTTPWTVQGPCWKQISDAFGLAAHDKLIVAHSKVYAWYDPATGTPKYKRMPYTCPQLMG